MSVKCGAMYWKSMHQFINCTCSIHLLRGGVQRILITQRRVKGQPVINELCLFSDVFMYLTRPETQLLRKCIYLR